MTKSREGMLCTIPGPGEPCPPAPLSPAREGGRERRCWQGCTAPLLRSLCLSPSPGFSFSRCRRAFQMKKLFPWHQTLNLKHTYKQPMIVITMHRFLFILFFFWFCFGQRQAVLMKYNIKFPGCKKQAVAPSVFYKYLDFSIKFLVMFNKPKKQTSWLIRVLCVFVLYL